MPALTVDLNLYGALTNTISFTDGLNILSGENGTFKSHILRQIKTGANTTFSGRQIPTSRIMAYSPKRNSERRSIEAIFQTLRSQNRRFKDYVQSRIQSQFREDVFDTYSSAGELYFMRYEEECRDGLGQRDKMELVKNEFNEVIRKVFGNYQLLATWVGQPQIKLEKHGVPIPIESLSCGEQEVLSLVLNIYISRDSYDVVLIDEPEIHLNWHLEEKLFSFLDEFCNTNRKLAIVATHSRVIFKKPFIDKTQFLVWQGNTVNITKEISPEQRSRIAGEAIDIFKIGVLQEECIFVVEDLVHEKVLQQISSVLNGRIRVAPIGNSSSVENLFLFSKTDGGWGKTYFLTDGDNKGNRFPSERHFIHLGKYCMENYLLDISTIAGLASISQDSAKALILQAIKDSTQKFAKENKPFALLLGKLSQDSLDDEMLNSIDASKMMPRLPELLHLEMEDYLARYVSHLHDTSRLSDVFPSDLISIIQNSSLRSSIQTPNEVAMPRREV